MSTIRDAIIIQLSVDDLNSRVGDTDSTDSKISRASIHQSFWRTISIMVMRMDVVLGGFALIAVVTLLQCVQGSIIGQDTPVWTAKCSHTKCDRADNPVTYTRLEKGAVKRAFDYYYSDRYQKIPLRARRSIHDEEHHVEAESNEYLARQSAEEVELKSLGVNGIRFKRANRRQRGTPNAAILVVVDYDPSAVTDDASREKYINEKILYTVAYMNNFSWQVYSTTYIPNWSDVYIHVVGIIIALNRSAVPYLDSSFSAEESVLKANDYWKTAPHVDFPRNAYHSVTTLTDFRPSRADYAQWSTGGGNVANIIMWDEPNFRAMHDENRGFLAVANTLNAVASRKNVKTYDYMNSGPEVQWLMPGNLMSPNEQCVSRGYLANACTDYSKNCELYCEKKKWYNKIFEACESAGKPLENTPCNNGVIG